MTNIQQYILQQGMVVVAINKTIYMEMEHMRQLDGIVILQSSCILAIHSLIVVEDMRQEILQEYSTITIVLEELIVVNGFRITLSIL